MNLGTIFFVVISLFYTVRYLDRADVSGFRVNAIVTLVYLGFLSCIPNSNEDMFFAGVILAIELGCYLGLRAAK